MNAAASAAAAASVSALNAVINSSRRSGSTIDFSFIHSIPDWVLVLFVIFFLIHGFKMIYAIFSRT